MLSATLCGEWDDIVHEQCFQAGWINVNVVINTTARGQGWVTLVKCKRLHLLTVYKKDAAKHHHLYMNVMVKKPHRMTIKSYYKCLKEINVLAPSPPCLKDQPDCLPEIERMNVSLTPINMCNLLIHNVLAAVEDEDNCITNLMPTDPKKLVEQLSRSGMKLKLVTSEMIPEDP